MAADTHINAVISQGSSIKEAYQAKKHNFEMQQQTETQYRIQRRREEKKKIAKFEPPEKIRIRQEDARRNKKKSLPHKREKQEQTTPTGEDRLEEGRIDILA